MWLSEQKQPATALRIVQDQIAKVPDNSGFYVLLGQVELRNQDSAKAEQAFQKAVDLDKNNVNAFLMLSSVQISRGSVDQAIAGYRSPLPSNPRDIRIYVALGSLLETRDQWQEAEDLYKKGAGDSARLCTSREQSCLSDAGTRRQRQRRSLLGANRPQRYARFTELRRHAGLGLLPAGSL